MSGGVDSSVAAALLLEQGYDVTGVTLVTGLWRRSVSSASQEDISARGADAAVVCEKLGIKHKVIDARNVFTNLVIDPFVETYLKGQTPNPCAVCNASVKFPLLAAAADEADAQHIATGHYANVDKNAPYQIIKARDRGKDQSYFLSFLTEAVRKRLVFPLGGFIKKEVRETAKKYGFHNADKEESQEICFVENADYDGFIKNKAEAAIKKGYIRDHDGAVLGMHNGVHKYTIGQRKSLGVNIRPGYYVIHIDNNDVYVGPQELLFKKEVFIERVLWQAPVPAEKYLECSIKLRSRHEEAPAIVRCLDGGVVEAVFELAQKSPTPGQAAVGYKGDMVIFGGWITKR